MNFTPDTKSGTDTNTHVASPARKNGKSVHNGRAGTYARGANSNIERKMKMTLREKVAEVEPTMIYDRAAGGVIGCPHNYKYLNACRTASCDLIRDYPLRCDDCWNREWKCESKPEITRLDAYQIEAMRTCSFQYGEQDKMMRHAVFGLCSESGEVAGILQKVFQGHEFDKEHFKKELGDCLWMIAEACTSVGATLSEIASMNIQKLRERYPDGFDPEKSKNRKEGDI